MRRTLHTSQLQFHVSPDWSGGFWDPFPYHPHRRDRYEEDICLYWAERRIKASLKNPGIEIA